MYIKEVLKEMSRTFKKKINPSNLRFYDRINLIPVRRADNNYRVYTASDVAKLTQALILSDLGIDLPMIKEVLTLKTPEAINDLKMELNEKARLITVVWEFL